jgi:hypothetical protein
MAGSDSILFPYAQIGVPNNYCMDTSWAGERIIIRPYGENVFYSGNDSVKILTNALLNQSWKLYSFSNGDYLEASLYEISSLDFLGVSDTVKKIRLTSKDAGGSNITHPFNNKEIWLSKNFGLIKWYNMRNFPDDTSAYSLIGNSNPLAGLQNFGAKEIFDYNVGDEFDYVGHWQSSLEPWLQGSYWQKFVILAKNFSNSDSVSYTKEVTEYTKWYDWSVPDSTINFYMDTSTLITRFNPFDYFRALPLEISLIDTFDDVTYTSSLDSFHYPICYWCKSFPVYYSLAGSCLEEFIGIDIFNTVSYCPGLGDVRSTEVYTGNGYNLVYFNKGDLTWGTPVNFSALLSIPDLHFENNFSVFPNPTSGKIFLRFKGNTSHEVQVSLADEAGKILQSFRIDPLKQNEIDLSGFAEGFYLVKLFDGINVEAAKIFKR